MSHSIYHHLASAQGVTSMSKEVIDATVPNEELDDGSELDVMKVDNINVWNVRGIPQFPGQKAYILPGAFYGACVALFAKAGFERANSVEEADVVVFIGGVDVDPKLYGEEAIAQTQAPSRSEEHTSELQSPMR